MSKYSGRSDLYDVVVMIHKYTEEELINNVDIYIGDGAEQLYIESSKDLIPYYPYLISSAGFNNEKRTATIYLSSMSCIDKEEEDILKSYFKQILTIYNKCRNKKTNFDIDKVVSQVCWDGFCKDAITELATRISTKGNKVTIDGIHLPTKDYYRKELVDEMIKNGLNPADYGYKRFM